MYTTRELLAAEWAALAVVARGRDRLEPVEDADIAGLLDLPHEARQHRADRRALVTAEQRRE